MHRFRACSVLLLSLAFALPAAWSHPGRLDSYGCHHNRKAGNYHCHQGPLAGRTFSSQAEMLATLKGEKTAPQEERPIKGNPDVKVWLNTNSGVYHCPGTRWYGATKQGEYMTQKQAQEKGNRPAYGKYCQ